MYYACTLNAFIAIIWEDVNHWYGYIHIDCGQQHVLLIQKQAYITDI